MLLIILQQNLGRLFFNIINWPKKAETLQPKHFVYLVQQMNINSWDGNNHHL